MSATIRPTDRIALLDAASSVRHLDSAIEDAKARLQGAKARRDRAEARLVQLHNELEHLSMERDRVLAGSTTILPAPARLVTVGRLLYWAVTCPYCGGEHRHGGDVMVPPTGGRWAHCHVPYANREYVIVPVDTGR